MEEMLVCINCGADNPQEADNCVRCGKGMVTLTEPEESDNNKVNIILAVLSFLIPVFGLIVGGMARYSAPRASRIYLLGATIIIGLWIIVLSALFVILPIVQAMGGTI